MARMAFPYSHGDTAVARSVVRGQQSTSDLGSAVHISTCATCHELVHVDTDGMGGLLELDPATYKRHRHYA